MKKLTKLLFIVLCLCLPTVLQAQKRDDSKYLAGAVPEEDGKVVFSKEFSIPGMSQDEIFERMQKWMDLRLKKNQNEISRVVYTNKEKGQVIGIGEEWLVFSSSALSLDRTLINYQLSAFCQPEKCEFRIEKIRYTYREGRDQEKYVAEKWITDDYALNKSQTKLVLGLAKWRRKTVDFADELCKEATQALSVANIDQIVVLTDEEVEEAKEKMEKSIDAFSNELVNIRTGRANPSMLDRVMVEYYGSPTPLNQVAGISVVEGRQLVIKPYDKNSMKDIEHGIYQADLGLTPQNDGTVIRIVIPPLTEERRKEMVKQVNKLAEEAKVALRNIRRNANADVEKTGETEDEVKAGKEDVQNLTNEFVKKIDQIAKEKEKDLMTV